MSQSCRGIIINLDQHLRLDVNGTPRFINAPFIRRMLTTVGPGHRIDGYRRTGSYNEHKQTHTQVYVDLKNNNQEYSTIMILYYSVSYLMIWKNV